MRVESFMKIEADADAPEGGSSDDSHAKEIELLSFEHDVARGPTRSDEQAIGKLNRARLHQAFGELNRARIHRDGDYHADAKVHIGKEVASKTEALASTLSHPPVTVLKIVDKASPFLQLWSTKTDKLLTTVTLTMRTLQPKGLKFEVQDLLQVKLNKAYICDMTIVGSFPEQPWLTETSAALWQSAPALDVGPVEQILIGYQKIEWWVNSKKLFAWDVKLKKSF